MVVTSTEGITASIPALFHGHHDGSETMETLLYMYHVMAPMIAMSVVVLNMMVLLSVLMNLKVSRSVHRKTTYLLMGNLSVVNCLTGQTVLFAELISNEERGKSICLLEIGLMLATSLGSAWGVVLIAADRYLYTLQGSSYIRWMTWPKAIGFILTTWLLAGGVGSLPAMGWVQRPVRENECWFVHMAPSKLIVLVMVSGILPLLLVAILLLGTLCEMKKYLPVSDIELSATEVQTLRMFRGNCEVNQARLDLWKSTKIVSFTAGSYMVTWVPYSVACCLLVSCRADHGDCSTLELVIASPLTALGFLNSLFTPLIYAWWNRGFCGRAGSVLVSHNTSHPAERQPRPLKMLTVPPSYHTQPEMVVLPDRLSPAH